MDHSIDEHLTNLYELLHPYNQFQILENKKPLRSAQEGAHYFGIELKQTAPTLILIGEGKYYACVVSGCREKVDMTLLASLLGCESIKLVDRQSVKALTGFDVGSIPIVGLKMPYILDKKLLECDFVYGGTGCKNKTLKINANLLEKVNQVIAWYDAHL